MRKTGPFSSSPLLSPLHFFTGKIFYYSELSLLFSRVFKSLEDEFKKQFVTVTVFETTAYFYLQWQSHLLSNNIVGLTKLPIFFAITTPNLIISSFNIKLFLSGFAYWNVLIILGKFFSNVWIKCFLTKIHKGPLASSTSHASKKALSRARKAC